MKLSLTNSLKSAAAVLACCALIGCMTDSDGDETQDGGNVVFAQEAKTMAAVLDGSSGAAKGSHHSPTLEKVIIALHYESACHCFVRSTEFTNTKKGFGRARRDSVWMYAGGQALADSFHPRNADSIVHVRHVTRIDGHSGKDVNFTVRTTLVRRQTDSGWVYFWTGTVDGIFKGKELAGSTFSLSRTWSLSNGFGKPAGSMFVKRGNHWVNYVLHADGSATCTVTRDGVFVRTTHIDHDDNES